MWSGVGASVVWCWSLCGLVWELVWSGVVWLRSGQIGSGQFWSGQVRLDWVRIGQVWTDWVRSGQVRSRWVRLGWVGPDCSGLVRSGRVQLGRARPLIFYFNF